MRFYIYYIWLTVYKAKTEICTMKALTRSRKGTLATWVISIEKSDNDFVLIVQNKI